MPKLKDFDRFRPLSVPRSRLSIINKTSPAAIFFDQLNASNYHLMLSLFTQATFSTLSNIKLHFEEIGFDFFKTGFEFLSEIFTHA